MLCCAHIVSNHIQNAATNPVDDCKDVFLPSLDLAAATESDENTNNEDDEEHEIETKTIDFSQTLFL